MAEIIDLGNGYGRFEGYGSRYASLTFPLTRYQILRLHALGFLSDDETKAALLSLGYEWAAVKWSLALNKVSLDEWRKAIERAGTI